MSQRVLSGEQSQTQLTLGESWQGCLTPESIFLVSLVYISCWAPYLYQYFSGCKQNLCCQDNAEISCCTEHSFGIYLLCFIVLFCFGCFWFCFLFWGFVCVCLPVCRCFGRNLVQSQLFVSVLEVPKLIFSSNLEQSWSWMYYFLDCFDCCFQPVVSLAKKETNFESCVCCPGAFGLIWAGWTLLKVTQFWLPKHVWTKQNLLQGVRANTMFTPVSLVKIWTKFGWYFWAYYSFNFSWG